MQTEKAPLRRTAEKINKFCYTVTKFDEEGWAQADKASPIPFDLVTVITNKGKICTAWWNQNIWDGLHLKKDEQVIKWKRRKYEYFT